MQTGTLRIQLITGGALPVNDAVVRISAQSGEVLYEVALPIGSDGETQAFELDVPDMALSFDEKEITAPYGLFNVQVLTGPFTQANVNGVQVFAGREALLVVNMLPRSAQFPSSTPPNIITIPPNALRLPPVPPGDTTTLLPQMPSPQLHTTPYIPETITVHLGVPTDFSVRNVTVSFQDYIKNVASSEIYPTWPEESIKANILAQISFVLNRVYTEWYRSRGYDFDITNSTAFDQYFVEGRNIFTNISQIVDEIFNIYIKKPGREEPFFALYCNGTTSTCDGLSQWGTVDLANDGFSARGILEYYYGNLDLVETDNLRGPFESYPGNPLIVGANGVPVRTVQEQLNRIAINYPSIPFVTVDSIYGPSTERSVRQFQRIFNLVPDGIVGKSTWYALSRVYVAVKNLAELTSEGERADYALQLYPGTPLRLGSKGVEVLEIQLYLSTIALYNNEVKTVALDGVFGESTLNSVVSFQRTYGIDPDGVVGETTWRRLVDVYNGIVENVRVPSVDGNIQLQSYPGTPLEIGSTGEDVLYLKRIINDLSNVFYDISPVDVNEEFDYNLSQAIRAFQNLVSLPETGIVDETTWNYLNDVYQKESMNNIFDLGSRPYSAPPLRLGDTGGRVRYIQSALERIRLRYNTIGTINVDGQFGTATEEAVKEFQRLNGLDPDGIVGENTWNRINETLNGISFPDIQPREEVSATDVLPVQTDTFRRPRPDRPQRPEPDRPQRPEPDRPQRPEPDRPQRPQPQPPQRPQPQPPQMPQPQPPRPEPPRPQPPRPQPPRPTPPRPEPPAPPLRPGEIPPYQRPLRPGSVGRDVVLMKQALVRKGYLEPSAAISDIYGITTRYAVEQFQRDNGLERTGRVDEDTWNAIFR